MEKGLQFCMETSDAAPSVCYNAYDILLIGFLNILARCDFLVIRPEAAKIPQQSALVASGKFEFFKFVAGSSKNSEKGRISCL